MATQSEDTISFWKQKAEEIKVQLNLGAKEAEEKFETEKKAISKWASEKKSEFSNYSSEQAKKAKAAFEELQLQATLGKAESRDALKEQEKKLQKLMQKAKEETAAMAKSAKDEASAVANSASEQLGVWQTKMDLFKLQLHLGAMEAGDEWGEKKKQIENKLNEWEEKWNEWKKDGSNNLEHFKSELSESWNHFKSAFSRN